MMTDILFTRGGITGGYYKNEMVGALGYFFGEPDQGFNNKEVLFLYVVGILPDYRATRLFDQNLAYTLRQMRGTCVTEVRMQAEVTDAYTNRLYSRFATPIGLGKSLRDKDVIIYRTTLEDALVYLQGKRPLASQYNAPPHALAPIQSHHQSNGV